MLKLIVIVFSLFSLIACTSSGWQMRAQPEPSAIVAALNTNPNLDFMPTLTLKGYPSIEMPKTIRPCCAFGNHQKVSIGSLKVPFFRYANTIDISELGAHSYDAGTLSLQRSEPSDRKRREVNGMIYTLDGGFLDIAHVRDTADNTVALFYQIYPLLGQEAKIKIPDELGERYIHLKAFDVEKHSAIERWHLTAFIAANLAFTMAEAHEIAQWHGYRSWKSWPETVSAFSPEDLYSNMLGAKITLALLVNNLAMTEELYDQHMTSWLYETIVKLKPLTKSQSNELFDAIDGHWWDSSVPLPNKFMLLKRDYQLGDVKLPLLVPTSLIDISDETSSLSTINFVEAKPSPLALPAKVYDQDISEIAEIILTIDEPYQKSFSHIPEALWVNGLSSNDFQKTADLNKTQDAIELKAWQASREIE